MGIRVSQEPVMEPIARETKEPLYEGPFSLREDGILYPYAYRVVIQEREWHEPIGDEL
jgi:hypothetical protein